MNYAINQQKAAASVYIPVEKQSSTQHQNNSAHFYFPVNQSQVQAIKLDNRSTSQSMNQAPHKPFLTSAKQSVQAADSKV